MRRVSPISALAARVKRELNPPVILRRPTQPNCGESSRPLRVKFLFRVTLRRRDLPAEFYLNPQPCNDRHEGVATRGISALF
jgi:hypothetical protein